MCGVAGLVSTGPVDLVNQQVEKALNRLSHRGPDDEGIEVLSRGERSVVFGHRRLSIIDLSSAGHQPMTSRDGRYTLVFNGEIYNYREIREELVNIGQPCATETDTEVLLIAWSLWGESILTRLIGMFAFAIFDSVNQEITVARDGFGIKPLFWSVADNQFCFASEPEALGELLHRPLAPNSSVVARFLMTGSYDLGEETFFDKVYRVEPGTALVVNLRNTTLTPQVRRWWHPGVGVGASTTMGDAVDLIQERFLESVRLHLRSDVPLGFALSGGIDSSAVVCAVNHLEPDAQLNTFSFVSPGAHDNEETWIDAVNKIVSANEHKVSANPENLHDDLLELIKIQGEPFGDTSIYAQYLVYRLAKEAGVTVTLDGQGADELFAGYSGYVERRLRSLVDEWKFLDAASLLGQWSSWPGRSRRGALLDTISLHLPVRWIATARSLLKERPGGINLSWLHGDVKNLYSRGFPISSGDHGRQLVSMLRWELTQGGLGNLMRHGDRNSMRWSIESRVPFLTIPLAEAALSLPEEFLLSPNGETKHVLRGALRGIVPDLILDRKDKIGFQTPESRWLLGLKSEILSSWLDGLDLVDVVNADVARRGIRHQLERGHVSQELWRYLNVSLWATNFFR